jgi:alkaline phosphatase D
MKNLVFLWCSLVLLASCKTSKPVAPAAPGASAGTFRIALGSCNDTDRENRLWDDVLNLNPDLWIWGGDNIYADTGDPDSLRAFYQAQKQVPGYRALAQSTPIIGTWDDHDYGLNDGGVEFPAKAVSQQEFLTFMGVPENSPRRQQEGVYTSHTYSVPGGTVKVIVLDTRYFRSPLARDPGGSKRFVPNPEGEGTVLGEAQWAWLERELRESDADFNILVSSIQVLSGQHGFETWGNFPHETRRLLQLIGDSGARGVLVLSGDRHISEFSRTASPPLAYPLVDFTSSGLTHAYRGFRGEPNPFRVGEVVSTESFGYLVLDFNANQALFRIVGDGGETLGELAQQY